jgi:uncharacterized membrane protein
MERTDLGRIAAFTDGVLAVAITLLVLNIDVPNVSEGDLRDALIDLLPSIYIYVLSFAVIGRFWVIHHNLFETLVRFDGMLMFLNLAFLLLVALLPFATDLLGEYPDSGLATASFSVSVALASLAHWSMSTYSVSHGFVHERHVPTYSGTRSIGALSMGIIFLAAAPLAFLATEIAHVMWIGTFLVRYPLRRLAT